MITLNVRDTVSGQNAQLILDEDATVADAIASLVATHGLPTTSMKRRPLSYDLVLDGHDDPFEASVMINALDLSDGGALQLVSPQATDVWHTVRGWLGRIEGELGRAKQHVVGAAQDEIRASGERVKAAAEREVRDVVGGVTQRIEAEVNRRTSGLKQELGIRGRRRVRKLVRQIAETGALPNDVSKLSFATGQLAQVARVAALPAMVGAVGVASVVGVGAVAAAQDDGPPPPQDSVAVADALRVAEDALLRAEDAVRIAESAEAVATEASGIAVEASGVAVGAQQEALDAGMVATEAELAATEAHDIVVAHAADALLHPDELAIRTLASQQVNVHLSTRSFDPNASGECVACVPPGGSLWELAETTLNTGDGLTCAFDPVPSPTNRQVLDYVTKLWIGNIGVIGIDPGAIDPGRDLNLVCPDTQ